MTDKLLTGTYQKHQLNKKIIISGGHIVIVDQVLFRLYTLPTEQC